VVSESVPVLSLRDVAKGFQSGGLPVPVLRRVSLDLFAGELVALVGRSGSGKTTLLSLVIGWDTADRGELVWTGRPVDLPSLRWGELAIVPQALGLLPELTIEENITAPVFLASDGRERDHRRLMDDLGIAHLARRYPAETSLGEQQRTAVARALVLGPQVVLADEPLAHQNDEWTEVGLGLFAELAMEGTAFLVATHDLAVLQAADRAVELHDGRLVALSPGETGGVHARRGSPAS
jgi:putative ABC transport system ATP-binding protein